MKPVRIGMIGYGGIGRVHAMAYRSLPFHYGLPADSVQLTAVATSHAATAQAAAAEIGCGYWTDDYRQLLARPDVDAVDVCVPNHLHAPVVLAAAAAGKHIYCEKPLAMDVTEARTMVQAVQAAGVITQMTFNFRFFPAVLRAQQLMQEGFLGRVFSFRGRYYRSSYIDPQKPLTWRQRKAVAGGGALFDIGSHILDLLYSLLGPYAAVQAAMDTLIRQRPVPGSSGSSGSSELQAVDVDDIALLHLRTADGVLGSVEVSRMGTGLTNDLQFEIFGERGALRFNAVEPGWLEVYDGRETGSPLGGMRGFRQVQSVGHYPGQKAPDASMAPDFVRGHAECQYQFLRAVAEGRPAKPDLADGLHIQAVMAAAERSSASGGWVQVEEENHA